MASIKVICRQCKETHIIEADESDYKKWETGGVRIQDALPYLKPEERELLISQICGVCWGQIFGE